MSSEVGQGKSLAFKLSVICGRFQSLAATGPRVSVPAGCPLEAALCPLPRGPPPSLEAHRQGSFSSRSLGGQSLSARRSLPHCVAWTCVRDHTSILVAVLNTVTSSHHLHCVHRLEASPSSCSWGGRDSRKWLSACGDPRGDPNLPARLLKALGTANVLVRSYLLFLVTILMFFHKEEEIGVLLPLCLWTPNFKRTQPPTVMGKQFV